jgi:type II secretory pathway component PulK
MMRRFDRPPRSSGAVLVLVLVTLLLFSTVVLRVVQHAALTEEEHVLLLQTTQAGFQAEAAVLKAMELLALSADHLDAADQPPSPPEWSEDGIRITIIPTNAKLNLNALHPPSLHSQAMTRLREGLTRLFQQAAPQETIHEGSRANFRGDTRDIMLWLGEGHDPDLPGSARAADAPYTGIRPSYRPRKGPMQRPEELLLVTGFTDLDPAWVRRHFTVWGTDGRINLNLADKELILAVAPELEAYWPAIQRHRTEHGFQRLDELIARIRLPMDVYQRVLPHLALEADTLEISVEVRQPAWYELHRIIVERPSILADTPPRILAREIIESRPL